MAPASPAVNRLLVLAPNWVGDAVMALPAIGDLRRAYPGARLIVAARQTLTGLFALAKSVDEVVPLEWSGGLLAVGARRRDLARLRTLGADAALLLPNSFASAWLALRSGVRERWGYAADFRRALLSRSVERPAVRRHQMEYYRWLVRQLGVENGSIEPDIEVPEILVSEARGLVASRGWDGVRPLVVLAPGAAYGSAKQWPPAHFARLAERLVADHDVFCTLVGSPADRPAAREVASLVDQAARSRLADLAGETTLGQLAGLMQLARACVANDSGAMHLAGAVGVPLAALFGPTRERETAPIVRAGARTELLVHHVWCRPCMLRDCPIDHRCMEGLTPDRVSRAVVNLLGGETRA